MDSGTVGVTHEGEVPKWLVEGMEVVNGIPGDYLAEISVEDGPVLEDNEVVSGVLDEILGETGVDDGPVLEDNELCPRHEGTVQQMGRQPKQSRVRCGRGTSRRFELARRSTGCLRIGGAPCKPRSSRSGRQKLKCSQNQ